MKSAHILLVGNDSGQAETIQKSLEQLGYLNISIVPDLRDAFTRISDSPPDLVVLGFDEIPRNGSIDAAIRIRRDYGIPAACLCLSRDSSFVEHPAPSATYDCMLHPATESDVCAFIVRLLHGNPLMDRFHDDEELFRLMIEDGSDLILILDESGSVIYQSPSIKRILGYSPEEIDGKGIIEFIYFEDHEKFYDSFSSFLQNPAQASPLELRVHHRDGSLRIIEAKAKNFARHASVRGIIANCRDITDRKRSESEIHKVQKLESLGILAGGIAHDFNNILTSILGNISLAKLESDPASELFEALTDAEKASHRARDLTLQLLTFSRGGAPVRRTMSLEPLIRETVSFTLHGSQITCDIRIPPDLWHADIDEGQISQVINNMLINSIQAMSESGIIEIDTGNLTIDDTRHPLLPPGEYIRISIRDHGIGISPALQQKIFDPYFTTKRDGSGLGLSTAYSIIKNHSGFIDVVSESGRGSCFHIYLPRSTVVESLPDGPVEGGTTGEGRILLMDDDEHVLKITGKILTRLGYTVDTAADGSEAFELYVRALEERRRYDAIILDLTIRGGLSGKATLEAVRQVDPSVIAVVASGYFHNPVMSDFRSYGFSACIRKPFQVQELGEVLSRLLNRA